ncbi:hypothetical protein BH09ACT6_BH09ACT6_24760 [soil metagenome]
MAESGDVDQRLWYRRVVRQAASSPPTTPELPAPSAISSGEPVAAEGPREIVIRPDGMRKGVWEASNAFFYVAAGVVGVLLLTWLLFRFGVVKLPKRKPKDEAPKSVRGKSSTTSVTDKKG